jgi:RNA polymerase sigma factor (sigma-70 family)
MSARGTTSDVLRRLRTLIGARQHEEASDGPLLNAFATERDEAAFAALVRRHGPMVLGVCRRVLGNLHDAEDVFQATFLTLALRAGAIRRRDSVGCWLHGVAYRLALRARARAGRQPPRPPAPPPEPADPLDTLTARELLPLLDEELRCLPERCRAPLVLCYLEERTHQEAARLLGCPVGTLRSRLQRGKDLLRVRLTRRGVRLPAALFAVALAEASALRAVPADAVVSTARAAARFATHPGLAGGAVSAHAAALTTEVLRAMFLGKLKTAAAVLLLVGVTGVGAVLVARATWAAQPDRGGQVQTPPAPEPRTTDQERGGQAEMKREPPALSKHGGRANRWVLKFDTKDGEEYARQLQALGAVLAVPDPKDKGTFRVIRDLAKRPVRREVEDLSKLDRIFWVDDDRHSVAGLAKAVGLTPVPDFIVAFFPQIVEDELLRKERAFAGLAEEDILETHFRVRRTKTGYDLLVVDQVRKQGSAPPSLEQENRQLRERLRKAEEEIERLRRQLDAVRKAVDSKPPADR